MPRMITTPEVDAYGEDDLAVIDEAVIAPLSNYDYSGHLTSCSTYTLNASW